MQNLHDYVQFHADDGTIIYVDRKDKKRIKEMRESGKYFERYELSL